MKLKNDDFEPWKVPPTSYKRKPEVIPTPATLLMTAMTASQTRIAETIDAFYGEAGTKDNVSAYYRQAVEDLDAETVKELVSPSIYIRFNIRTVLIELALLIRYPVSAHTSPTSTKPLKNAPINSLITTLFAQK
jgi:hypothetical protein